MYNVMLNTYIYSYTYIHTYIYTYTYIHIHIQRNTHIHTHIHTYIHIPTYIYINLGLQTQRYHVLFSGPYAHVTAYATVDMPRPLPRTYADAGAAAARGSG